MVNSNKKTMVGFKANDDELDMINDLLLKLRSENPAFADKITISDVLRNALAHYHVESFMPVKPLLKGSKKVKADVQSES